MNFNSLTIDFSNDPHTARFFDAKYHRGRVEKFFRIDRDDKAPLSQVLAGRRAQLLTGEEVIVAQPFFLSPSGGVARKGAFLVAEGKSTQVKNPHLSAWERLPHDDFAHLFWARELFGSGGSPPLQRCAFPLPSLSHLIWLRYHVVPHAEVVLQVSPRGYAYLLYMDARSRRSDDSWEPIFDVDAGWPKSNSAQAVSKEAVKEGSHSNEDVFILTDDLVAVEGEAFHQRLNLIASEDGSLLFERLRFARLNEEERACEVLGCDLVTLQRAMELFRLALQAEMYEGSALGVYEALKFRPFMPNPNHQLERVGARGASCRLTFPASLRQRRLKIFKALKCHAARSCYTPEGRNVHINDWAAQLVCRCSPLESMHEVFVAETRFNELLKAYRMR